MKSLLLTLICSTSLLFAATSKQDKTGLVWQDNNDVATVTKNYHDAKAYCSNLTLDGFNDWRLPTLKEYYTIIDMTQDRPALKNGFEVRIEKRFWTVTPFAGNPEKEAWFISSSYGEAEPYRHDRAYHVRCVRGSIKK